MNTLPSLFLAHGAPDLVLSDHAAKRFLTRLAGRISRPRAIVIISAHWEASVTTIGSAPRPVTVHDFSGWPAALYDTTYPARTDPVLIREIIRLLDANGIQNETNPTRGYDHGVWAPLSLVYPKADIPVVQISLTRNQPPAYHLRLGAALAALRAEGVLIIGSGATVHNLHALGPEGSQPPTWAVEFEAWLHGALTSGDIDELLAFPQRPDVALKAHPTPEHLMPFYVCLGAAMNENRASRLHRSFSYASIGMSCYAFGEIDGAGYGGA